MSSPGSKTFVHLSDIHFHRSSGSPFDLDRDLRENLQDDVLNVVERLGENVDAILVTGDIAFSGKGEEFETAHHWLETLCELLHCEPQQVWVVPGNHDVDCSRADESKMLRELQERIRTAAPEDVTDRIQELCTDIAIGTSLLLPLQAYSNFASRYSCQISNEQLYWDTNGLFMLDDEQELRIQGLTTVLASYKDRDTPREGDRLGSLALGSFQVPIFKRNTIYMTMAHHPPNWLRDESCISKHLDHRAMIQLYGHEHEHQVSCDERRVRLVASAVHPERQAKSWAPGYNVFRVELSRDASVRYLEVSIYPRVWNSERFRFEENTANGLGPYVCRLEIDAGRLETEAAPPVDTSKEVRTMVGERSDPMQRDSGFRRVAYRYLVLPFEVRIRIANRLNLLEEDDENQSDVEKFSRILRRVRERDMTKELESNISFFEDGGGE